jgi:hypothetical protein
LRLPACLRPEKSASAFLTHSAVSRFIKYSSVRNNFLQEGVPFCQTPTHVMRCTNNNIQGKWRIDCQADLHCLIELIATRHDDENINIAVSMRLAVGVRSEQKNLVGAKLLHDVARKATNYRLRDVGAAIPPRILWFQFRAGLVIIICILRCDHPCGDILPGPEVS